MAHLLVNFLLEPDTYPDNYGYYWDAFRLDEEIAQAIRDLLYLKKMPEDSH